MGEFKVKENGVAYLEDDGGAAKSNERLMRRRRNRILQVVKYPIGVAVMYFSLSYFIDGNDSSGSSRSGNGIGIGIGTGVKESISQRRANFQRALRYGASSRNNNNKKQSQHRSDDNSGDGEKREDVENMSSSEKGYRWAKESILPPMHGEKEWAMKYLGKAYHNRVPHDPRDFKIKHKKKFEWEAEVAEMDDGAGPKIDYTDHDYDYPDFIPVPPRGGSYPPMEPLGDILDRWPQDDIDKPPFPFEERLQHFDFNEPEDMAAAKLYRDIEFPFKLINVPELMDANEKWTDEYVSYHFDRNRKKIRHDERMRELDEMYSEVPKSDGHCQESVDSFFAFFNNKHWDVEKMGDPPTLDNDFTFERWASHARYADAVSLDETETHYYWQSGVPRRERLGPDGEQTMISLDLPSFADSEPNFISFNPKENKGIQCRFGERGVTAATHYDGGRNMVGMITGAKRYILSPPKECPKLGIVTDKRHPTFRHSLLNFGHINILDSDESKGMPATEREWLETARSSLAIDTVLKAGEILYIPSHWFHYIVSLQKSAQCNVRSGREFEGTEEWGSSADVMECVGEEV